LTAALRWRKMGTRWLTLPCLIYAALMLMTTLKNTSMNPTYVSSILPALAIVSGVVLASWFSRFPSAVSYAATAIVILAVMSVSFLQAQDQLEHNRGFNVTGALVSSIRSAGPAQNAIMVPYEYVPTMSYYFPRLRVHPILPTDDASAVMESVHDEGFREVVYVGRDTDEVPRRLREQYHVAVQTVGPVTDGQQMYLYRLT
jgi:hypothetical protein